MTERSWCARCQFPGLAEFTYGTVFADSEMEALGLVEADLAEVLPVLPEILSMLPGMVVFHPREEIE